MSTVGDDKISSALFGKTRRKVLGLFFSHPDESYYLRQVARMTGIAPGTVHRELKRLAGAGLLTRSACGQQQHYRANKDCPVFEELKSLMLKTAGLADELRKAIAPLAEKIEFAAVYGSLARGTAAADSDVDLLIVGDIDELELHRRISGAENKLSRSVNYSLLDRGEFDRRRKEKGGFLDRIIKEQLTFLVGSYEQI